MRPTMVKAVDSPKDFAIHASRLIQSLTMLQSSKEGHIKDPLGVHKVERKINDNGVTFSKCYRLSLSEKPFYTHFYQKSSDLMVCDHEIYQGVPNRCTHYLNGYHISKDWIQCSLCKNWYSSEDCFSA